MTTEPVELAELLRVRDRLVAENLLVDVLSPCSVFTNDRCGAGELPSPTLLRPIASGSYGAGYLFSAI